MVKIGYLGPQGTYTEAAAQRLYPTSEHVPYASIEAVFAAVAAKEVTFGVLPIENVVEGPVTQTLDGLCRHMATLHIVDAQVVPIRHAIGCLRDGGPFTTVVSKDQALWQCGAYLAAHHPNIIQVTAPSTAAAVAQVKAQQRDDHLVIAAPSALSQAGFRLLGENIGDVPDNKTRFIAIAQRSTPVAPLQEGFVCAVVISPRHDRVGMLQEILDVISRRHRLSCCSIHSRPDKHGTFRFHLEVEGHMLSPRVQRCLASLRETLSSAAIAVSDLGTYPQATFYPQHIKSMAFVGGGGRMGRLLTPLFRRAGIRVKAFDKEALQSDAQSLSTYDAIFVSVPLEATQAVLEQVAARCRPGQLLVDNTSVKSRAVETMLKFAKQGVEVLGMHTVFGPHVRSLGNQNVVFTPTPTCGPKAREFETLFYKYGAVITRTTPTEHDRHMALHQNLEHLLKITLADMLCDTHTHADTLARFASPNSRLTLASLARILSGDPALYASIQVQNSEAPTLIRAFIAKLASFADAIEAGDSTLILQSLQRARAHFSVEERNTMLSWLASPPHPPLRQ